MKNESHQLYLVSFIVALSFIGASVVYPIFAPMFLHPNNIHTIFYHWSLKERAVLLGFTLAVYPLGLFLGSPIMGALSDQFGRKKLLVLSLAGASVGYLLTAIAIYDNNILLLIFSRLFTGAFDSNYPIARAIAADLKSISQHKTQGMIGGSSAIGYIIGPIIGGVFSDQNIVSWFNYTLPFLIAFVTTVATTVFVMMSLKESFRPVNVKLFSWKVFNLYARFSHVARSSSTLTLVILISTIFTLGVDTYYEWFPAYLTDTWHLGSASIAIYSTCVAVGLGFSACYLADKLSSVVNNFKMIIFGISFFIGFMLLAFFVPLSVVAILYFLIGGTIGLVNTSFLVMVTHVAKADIQGETMGVMFSLRMFGDAIICMAGGFMLLASSVYPMIFCIIAAAIAFLILLKRKSNVAS